MDGIDWAKLQKNLSQLGRQVTPVLPYLLLVLILQQLCQPIKADAVSNTHLLYPGEFPGRTARSAQPILREVDKEFEAYDCSEPLNLTTVITPPRLKCEPS